MPIDNKLFYETNISLTPAPDMDTFLTTLQQTAGVLGPNNGNPNAFVVGLNSQNFNKNNDIELVLGIGASIHNPSYVFGAYLITLLDAVCKLQKQGFSNTIGKIVLPTFFSSLLNEMDQQVAIETQKITISFINEFVKKFYPDVMNSLVIITDTQELAKTQFETSQKIVSLFNEKKSGFNVESHILSTLSQRSQKYSTVDSNGLLYAVSHPFYEGIIGDKGTVKVIIKIGGKPEHAYLSVTNSLVNVIKSDESLSQKYNINPYIFLTTKSGKSPLYYPKPGEPTILEGVYDKEKFQREKDLELLKQSIGIEAYNNFVDYFRSLHNR